MASIAADFNNEEFHLDEPWDREHNKKLIPRMPALYVSPVSSLKRADGKTTIVVPAGPKLVFNGTQKMMLRDITDGAANTILLMDVDDSKAVLWTKPDDYPVEQIGPTRTRSGPAQVDFHAGSIRATA